MASCLKIILPRRVVQFGKVDPQWYCLYQVRIR